MTTLEIVLLCTSGVETIITIVWSYRIKKRTREFAIYCSQRAIYHDAVMQEYQQILNRLQVPFNAG